MKKLLIFISGFMIFPAMAVTGQFREFKDGIGIAAMVCKPDEVLVDSEGWKLTADDFLKKGFYPVRINVENKSGKVVSISEASVQYSSIEMKQIAEQFKVKEGWRTLGYWIIGNCTINILNIPIVYWLIQRGYFDFGHVYTTSENIARRSSFLIGWFSTYSAPFYWWRLHAANNRLYSAVSHALHEGALVIRPGEHVQKILLVPQEAWGPFTFSIFTQENFGILTKFTINCA